MVDDRFGMKVFCSTAEGFTQLMRWTWCHGGVVVWIRVLIISSFGTLVRTEAVGKHGSNTGRVRSVYIRGCGESL